MRDFNVVGSRILYHSQFRKSASLALVNSKFAQFSRECSRQWAEVLWYGLWLRFSISSFWRRIGTRSNHCRASQYYSTKTFFYLKKHYRLQSSLTNDTTVAWHGRNIEFDIYWRIHFESGRKAYLHRAVNESLYLWPSNPEKTGWRVLVFDIDQHTTTFMR